MSKAQAQAEMRVYRAYCYWYVMDMFGTAPICEKIGEINPSSKSRAELFAWIEKELNESIPSLSESKTETYGRVSKWGAYALLARLYLNAEIYTGQARWDDCIAACDELAKGGFALDKKWNDTFRADNDKRSTEIICQSCMMKYMPKEWVGINVGCITHTKLAGICNPVLGTAW